MDREMRYDIYLYNNKKNVYIYITKQSNRYIVLVLWCSSMKEEQINKNDIYIYVYIYIYTHTHTHIYVYVYTDI